AAALTDTENTRRLGHPQIGNHGFAGNGRLARADQRGHAWREEDVDPGAEADHADALAGRDDFAFAHERHDAPRHQARDLDDSDAGRARGRDHEHVALIVLARFVEIGAEEGALAIDHPLDAASERTAIHMTVEHAHKDGNAGERALAEAQLSR